MNCDKCGKKAVIELKYMGKKLCKSCFSRIFERRVRKNLRGTVNKKEPVAVAVSGGKDSMVMLHLLNRWEYNITAICVDEGIESYREHTLSAVKTYCSEHKIPYKIFSFKEEFGITIDELKERKKHPCSYCGVLRRNLINRKVKNIYSKIIMAHNLDDEVQTLIMNFFRGELERMARAGLKVGIKDIEDFVPVIKPLRNIPEKEIVTYALIHNIPFANNECPYSFTAYRRDIAHCLNFLENKHPGTKFAILSSGDKLAEILKSYFLTGAKPDKCRICGNICKGDICKVCELLKEISS